MHPLLPSIPRFLQFDPDSEIAPQTISCSYPPFSGDKCRNWFAHSNRARVIKLPRPLLPTTRSTRSLLSGVLRFPGLHLSLKRLVLFRQRIAGSRHGFDLVSQLAVLFLKFRHAGLQLLVLLQGFCVLAGGQGQTQQYRRGKSRPSVSTRHASSILHKNLNRSWNMIAGEGGRRRWQLRPAYWSFIDGASL